MKKRKFYTIEEMAEKLGIDPGSLGYAIRDRRSKFYGLRYERDVTDDSIILFPKDSADYWMEMFKNGWM